MPQELFLTKAAAARIIPGAIKIEAIRVFKGTIQVTYITKKGRCSTFLSKKAFYLDFTTFRLESASHCRVERWSAGTYTSRYSVYSKDSENTRTVDTYGMPNCSCPDYEKQRHYLGRAMPGCKHIMAVMGQLGHASLQDYRDAQAVKESKKRCSSCNGSGNICDWNGNITERCHDCRGSGYKKFIEIQSTSFDLFGGGWDEQPQHLIEPHADFIDDIDQENTPQLVSASNEPKKQRDPFGGFNF